MEIRQTLGQRASKSNAASACTMAGRPSSSPPRSPTTRTSDVTLGTAKMLNLSEDDRGWWHLADLLRAPAAVGYPGASPPCRPAPDEESLAAAAQQYGSSGVLALAQRESPGGLAIGALSAQEGSPSGPRRIPGRRRGHVAGGRLVSSAAVVPPGQTIAVGSRVALGRGEPLRRPGATTAMRWPPWRPNRSAPAPTPCGAVGIRSAWGSARRSCWPTRRLPRSISSRWGWT